MKRLLATIFLLIFLFNVIGYYAVYLGLKSHANLTLQQQLDANAYDETETLTFKVPLTLPYQSDWQSFQRVDGDFERNGEFYNLVKQKVERDTLIVVYIKDQKEASLFESLTEFVHASTDTPMSKKAGKLIENFTKDYIATSSELQTESAGWTLDNTYQSVRIHFSPAVNGVASPPPKG